MSLGEIVLLLLVGIVVVGPRNLPSMMRTAGQWIGRLRRMTTDLRSQSGIDDILRHEGLDEHIHQLRSLSRLNMVETLMAPAAAPVTSAGASAAAASASPYSPAATPYAAAAAAMSGAPAPTAPPHNEPWRMREYPLIGCDAYGVLPDDAVTYRMMATPQPVARIAPIDAATPLNVDPFAVPLVPLVPLEKTDAAAELPVKTDAAADPQAKTDAELPVKTDAAAEPPAKTDAAAELPAKTDAADAPGAERAAVKGAAS